MTSPRIVKVASIATKQLHIFFGKDFVVGSLMSLSFWMGILSALFLFRSMVFVYRDRTNNQLKSAEVHFCNHNSTFLYFLISIHLDHKKFKLGGLAQYHSIVTHRDCLGQIFILYLFKYHRYNKVKNGTRTAALL